MDLSVRPKFHGIYALGIVVLLATSQGYAFIEQWREGFVPFKNPPQRVALSWDMFAVQIERCEIHWDPPSAWEGRELRSLHDLSAPIEWDPVYNRRQDYISAAAYACSLGLGGPAQGATRAIYEVRCFLPGAKETREQFECPR